MPRSSAIAVENTFIRGLITEATGLNYPEHAAIETYDCIFDRDGTVKRRLGFDIEHGAEITSATHESTGVTRVFRWDSVADDGDRTFFVTQIDNILTFYQDSLEDSLSNGKKGFTIDLEDFLVSGSSNSVQTVHASMAHGGGKLYVAHPYCEPFYVEYDPNTDTVSTTQVTIQVRDFVGVADGYAIDERRAAGSETLLHKYNLYNQGWWVQDVRRDGSAALIDPYDYFESVMAVYPANSDIWYLGRQPDGDLKQQEWERHPASTSPGPKGHYILDAFNQDRAAASGISVPSSDEDGHPTKSTTGFIRPSSVAFYAGRVWWSGVDAPGYGNRVYFSQVVREEDDVGKCYQDLDPTDENYYDLVDTDGGDVQITEAGTIKFMVPIENYLIIFASNGIWYVSGSEGGSFKATDYNISKMSNIHAVSELSVVLVGGLPMWWNENAIYTITFDQATRALTAQDMTGETIEKDYFEDIPVANIPYAQGAYDSKERVVYWVYRSDAATTTRDLYTYDRVLCYNTQTQAFYPWTISEPASGPLIKGVCVSRGQLSEGVEENVVDSGAAQVTDAGGDDVTIFAETTEPSSRNVPKFLMFQNTATDTYAVTFAQTINSGYLDWFSFDDTGTDYTSYFVTGFMIGAEAMKDVQSQYITVFSNTVTNSEYFLRSIWDYSTDASGARYSTAQNAYIARSNRSVQQRRLKIRGHGKVVQLYFYSSSGKPFECIGWADWLTANETP